MTEQLSVRLRSFPGLEVLETVWLVESFVMEGMVGRAGHQDKVFNTIVVLNAVDVVNDLVTSNRTTDMGAHYKNVLADVSILPCIGVVWPKNENIALGTSSSARPVRVQVPAKLMTGYVGFWKPGNPVFISKYSFTASASARDGNGL